MKCMNCGMELSENMKFCISCGTPVQQMRPIYREEPEQQEESGEAQKEEKVCPHCGALLVPGYKFCTSCGSRVSEAAATSTPEPEAEPSAASSFTPKTYPYPSDESPLTPRMDSKPASLFVSEPNPAEAVSDTKESSEGMNGAEAMPEMAEEQAGKFAENATDGDVPVEEFIPEKSVMEEDAPDENAHAESSSEENAPGENAPLGSSPEEISAEEGIPEEVFDPDGDTTEEDDETLTSEIFVIVLTDLEDPQKQYKAPIEEEILIGRKRADIVIPDDREISRSHCRIVRKEERLCLVDAMSKNGTYYQDCRIEPNQEIPIESGDTFRIGKHSFKVELSIEAV